MINEEEKPFKDISLTWANNKGVICKFQSVFILQEKPEFSFKYDALYAEDGIKPPRRYITSTDEFHVLTNEEINEVLDYVDQEAPVTKVLGINEHGEYLGNVEDTDPRIKGIVPMGPPNGDPWYWDGDEWVFAFGVDKNGIWKGRQKRSILAKETPPPPTEDGEKMWQWDFELDEWIDNTPVSISKKNAIDRIYREILPGFMESVYPVQEMVVIYQNKFEEAQRYMNKETGPFPYLEIEKVMYPKKSFKKISEDIIHAHKQAKLRLLSFEESRRVTVKLIKESTTNSDVDSAVRQFETFVANAQNKIEDLEDRFDA